MGILERLNHSRTAKRVIDVVGASAIVGLTFPISGAAAVLVRAKMGSPTLFRQQRPGLNGEIFELMKFRTMSNSDPALGDAARLTRVGKFLRQTSIDELPQLWNVLRGDMSLVGPRPLLPQYLPRYDARQALRHNVKPGITGWAQVNGRNSTDWPTRFELDAWYVENWSNLLDLKILAKTVGGVLRRDGISDGKTATMTEFMGNQARASELHRTAP